MREEEQGTYGVSVISSRSAMVGVDEMTAGGEGKSERRALCGAELPRCRHAPHPEIFELAVKHRV